jgi:hypothetical protein
MDLVHPDVLTLADLLRAEWPAARERIRASGHPTCEGDEDDDEAATVAAEKAAADAEAAKKAAGDESDGDADDDKITKDDDWQTKARKSERQRKREADERKRVAAERDELAAKLAKIEESNLSAQEKAIKAAREEAAGEVTSKYEAERRADRIESAVTRLALTGFSVKDGDKDVTLKFADPDDAQLRLDRAIRNEEITYDELYVDGKVQKDALTAFLTELLEEHPRLRAPESNGGDGGRKVVDFDGGKGKQGAAKALEEMSPDEHLKAIQGTR